MPQQFAVRLTKRFIKDLATLPKREQSKVLQSLKRLEMNPFGPAPQVKKLKSKGIGQWRLRTGDYRVRYDIFKKDVVLYRVRHRKDVYKK